MTLFDEMLSGLRDARLIASPYARSLDDPDARRRACAVRFDAVIAKAVKGRLTSSDEATIKPTSHPSSSYDE